MSTVTAMTNDVYTTADDGVDDGDVITHYDKNRYTDLVTSEVHEFAKEETVNPRTGAVLSRFEFSYPTNFEPTLDVSKSTSLPSAPNSCPSPPACETLAITADAALTNCAVDEDGDLLVPRKESKRQGVVIIEHQQSTPLSLVGEQVWRGAMFLADFLLYSGASQQPSSATADPGTGDEKNMQRLLVDVRGRKVLELASGVGLTALVAGMMAQSVLATDIHRGNILRLIQSNLRRNSDMVTPGTSLLVEELDFCRHSTIDRLLEKGSLDDVSVILAADVVYHNDLTDQFFDTVHRLMSHPPSKVMLVALEKRFVFTTTEMDTVAPCYDYFLHCLDRLARNTFPHPGAVKAATAASSGGVESIAWTVTQINSTDFPQYFAYERSQHLILWRIEAALK